MTNAVIGKHTRVLGDERASLRTTLVDQYVNDGLSIRQLALNWGRSYGFIHRMLIEAGVTLRSRGGARKQAS